MVQALTKSVTLAEFLALPETKPASEYINGKIIQKRMPKGRHSRLQQKLVAAINGVAEDQRIALALPELRCTFGNACLVPDIAVFSWNRLVLNLDSSIADNFEICPDWTVEILSPEQSSNRVIKNILHCIQHGTRLGWLIDPDDLSVLVFQPNQQPVICQEQDSLPVIPELALELTAQKLFSWLVIS